MAENVAHESHWGHGPGAPRGPLGTMLGGFGALVLRLYALVILVLVVWAGYTAVAYLVRTVFKPVQVPPQYRTWEVALPGRLAQEMQSEKAAELVPRAPLSHYHRVERTLPPDLHNGCLTSGCHNALTHTQRKEIRAFANLHATFLRCGLCHDADISGQVPAMWVDDATGGPAQAPSALQLMKLLSTQADRVKDKPVEVQAELLALLSDASSRSADPVLKYLYAEVSTSDPGSPVWRKAVGQLIDELPNHVRGEYGEKITRKASADELRAYNQHLVDLSKPYLQAPNDSPERKRLYDEIHKDIVPKPSACSVCHGDEPSRIDLEALGYAPERAAALRSSMTAHLMQQIRTGTPFYLPKVLEGGHERK